MSVENPLRFRGGRNIAMKLPPERFDATLAFYRDALGLPVERREPGTAVVTFGQMRLWLDRVATVSQAEIWLEIETSSAAAAAGLLESADVIRCDDIEPLPDGFKGFWIKNPADIVHLVAEPNEED
jgi:catechol 2,3-dioxygenase-like lactoylglutathione lyase family enzyme